MCGVAKDAADNAGCVASNDKLFIEKLIKKGVAVVMA
jgi:rRNA-processing protein FCF1